MIVIQLEKHDKDLIEAASNLPQSEIILKKNFDGGHELIEFLIKITPISLPLIAKVIVEAIRSKKHIVVKHKGITIQGIDPKNALKILEKLTDKE